MKLGILSPVQAVRCIPSANFEARVPEAGNSVLFQASRNSTAGMQPILSKAPMVSFNVKVASYFAHPVERMIGNSLCPELKGGFAAKV
jgi:hypothetical protein